MNIEEALKKIEAQQDQIDYAQNIIKLLQKKAEEYLSEGIQYQARMNQLDTKLDATKKAIEQEEADSKKKQVDITEQKVYCENRLAAALDHLKKVKTENKNQINNLNAIIGDNNTKYLNNMQEANGKLVWTEAKVKELEETIIELSKPAESKKKSKEKKEVLVG
jgi:chromosome segregation ATPase